ncbi:MAG: NusG domain II-containing protein [Oscillospiraceae bacterium]|nr:NusG domain II-containing protein [Oscillospiraceae bacterium]
MSIKILKKSDIVLIAGFFVFAAAFLLVFFPGQTGSFAVIKVNGRIYREAPLGQNIEIKIYSDDKTLSNIVYVQDKKVSMSYSNCPGKFCVAHRPVGPEGGVIVCLPNRVTVEIRPDKGKAQIFDTVIGKIRQ